MAVEIFAWIGVGAFLLFFRGLRSTDFLFFVSCSLFHAPLALGAVSGNSMAFVSSEALSISLLACTLASLAFTVGGGVFNIGVRERVTRLPEHYTCTPIFFHSMRLLGICVFFIAFFDFLSTSSAGYTAALTAYVIHPFVDWLVVGAYVVMLAIWTVVGKPKIRRYLLAMIPLFPLILAGSRHVFFGPLVGFLIIQFLYGERKRFLQGFRELALASVFGMLVLNIFSYIRQSRVVTHGGGDWFFETGLQGFLLETGRTVRIVDWAFVRCDSRYDLTEYLLEALRRLIPGNGKGMENMADFVTGGGNGFSFVAEGICLGGTAMVPLWALVFGVIMGATFSYDLTKRLETKALIKVFLFFSFAIIWPRDELLGYVRELVWMCFILPWFMCRFFTVLLPMHNASTKTL